MTENNDILSLEQIQDLRERYLRGEEIPEEELRKALASLRARRAVPTKRSRTAALKGKSLSELLDA